MDLQKIIDGAGKKAMAKQVRESAEAVIREEVNKVVRRAVKIWVKSNKNAMQKKAQVIVRAALKDKIEDAVQECTKRLSVRLDEGVHLNLVSDFVEYR